MNSIVSLMDFVMAFAIGIGTVLVIASNPSLRKMPGGGGSTQWIIATS